MSDEFLSEIRDRLEAIRLAVTRPTIVCTPKVKAPPKTAYGWFKRSWPDAEFRTMIFERLPALDDALEDPVNAYRGLNKDEKAIGRALFKAQRDDGSSDA